MTSTQHFLICFQEMKTVMSPPTCMLLTLYAKAVAKAVIATSTPPHCSRSLSYNHRILAFIVVKVEKCIEHGNDSEEEKMEDDRCTYRVVRMALHRLH